MNNLKKKLTHLFLFVTVALAVCVSVSGCLSKKYSVSTLSGMFEDYWIYFFRISLNPDSTYMFHYMFSIADLSSDGNWWIEGKYVVLNSYVQNKECFPVNVNQVNVLPQKDDIIILCDKVAYQKCLMCFSTAGDSITINSDTIILCHRSFPDTINICIKANAISGVLCKSEDIIIKEPGIYRVETKGIFLRERPLHYLPLKRRKFKILSNDSIQDVFSTNTTLKRNIYDTTSDGLSRNRN